MRINKRQEIVLWFGGLLLAATVYTTIVDFNGSFSRDYRFQANYVAKLTSNLVANVFPLIVITALLLISFRKSTPKQENMILSKPPSSRVVEMKMDAQPPAKQRIDPELADRKTTEILIPLLCFIAWIYLVSYEPRNATTLAFPLEFFGGVILGNCFFVFIIVSVYPKIRNIKFSMLSKKQKIILISFSFVISEVIGLLIAYRQFWLTASGIGGAILYGIIGEANRHQRKSYEVDRKKGEEFKNRSLGEKIVVGIVDDIYWLCPTCREHNPKDATICRECGQPVEIK